MTNHDYLQELSSVRDKLSQCSKEKTELEILVIKLKAELSWMRSEKKKMIHTPDSVCEGGV